MSRTRTKDAIAAGTITQYDVNSIEKYCTYWSEDKSLASGHYNGCNGKPHTGGFNDTGLNDLNIHQLDYCFNL